MAGPSTAITFHKPFAEQQAAFRLRMGNLVPTSRWDDIWKGQHDRAFMVAGATKAELLADLADAVDKSITQGTTFDQFQKDFRGIVEKHGWHGWTGEGSAKGEAWRMRVIYKTNMRTSYMAGRWAQLQRPIFKFWIYRHGGSIEPRKQHLGWDGLVLERGHPFWNTHFPPNGWGCSCEVSGAMSREHAARKGGDLSKSLPDGWQAPDPKTGEPAGIGRGWGYAPGSSVAETVNALAPKLDTLPEQPSVELIQSWLTETLFGEWFAAPKGNWPIARIAGEQAEAIGAATRVVMISEQTAVKQLREHPELTIFDYGQAQRVISEATEVIQDGPQTLIYVFAPDGYGGQISVVKATRDGAALFLTSFRRLSASQVKRDLELSRLLKKRE